MHRTGYIGGTSYIETRSFDAAEATETTRGKPAQVQVSTIDAFTSDTFKSYAELKIFQQTMQL